MTSLRASLGSMDLNEKSNCGLTLKKTADKVKSKKLAIYTFIDAFGWEIYQQYGFLNKLLPHSRKLETTFGFSSAADPSILTGRYPDEHGHWSSFYYSPETSPFKHFNLFFNTVNCPLIFDNSFFIIAKLLGSSSN